MHSCSYEILMELIRIFLFLSFLRVSCDHQAPMVAVFPFLWYLELLASDSFEDFVSSELKFHKGHEAWISSWTTVHCTWNSLRTEKEDVCWIPIAQRNRFIHGMSSVVKQYQLSTFFRIFTIFSAFICFAYANIINLKCSIFKCIMLALPVLPVLFLL